MVPIGGVGSDPEWLNELGEDEYYICDVCFQEFVERDAYLEHGPVGKYE
jgi:hypothetical protein